MVGLCQGETLQDHEREQQQESQRASTSSSYDLVESEQLTTDYAETEELGLVLAAVEVDVVVELRWTEMRKKDRNAPCALVPYKNL